MKDVGYIVVRKSMENIPVPIGIFLYLEDAEDNAAAWKQEMVDRGLSDFDFEIVACAFYD